MSDGFIFGLKCKTLYVSLPTRSSFYIHHRCFNDNFAKKCMQIGQKGPFACPLVNVWPFLPKEVFINYVGKILKIFEPLHPFVDYISLCSIVDIWLPPLELTCQRSLWMPPTLPRRLSSQIFPPCKLFLPPSQKRNVLLNYNDETRSRSVFKNYFSSKNM